MNKFQVAPFDQHLSCNGRDLNDNQATLAALRIFPGTLIILQVTERVNGWVIAFPGRVTEWREISELEIRDVGILPLLCVQSTEWTGSFLCNALKPLRFSFVIDMMCGCLYVRYEGRRAVPCIVIKRKSTHTDTHTNAHLLSF